MRVVSRGSLSALLALAMVSPLQAMAPLVDDRKPEATAFNAMVERQNSAFAAGDFETALELNAKLLELAKPILAERPSAKGMIAYDRAVILMRKGNAAAGLAVLDESYASGDLREIGAGGLPVDYYGNVMTAYVDALRTAGRPEWREVQGRFINELFEGAYGNSMLIATWTNVAMVDLKDAGFVAEATGVCQRQLEWFEANPDAAKPSGFAAIGRPTVFVSDLKKPAFITSLALRAGRYESNYAFLRADLEDTCGQIMEVAGDLDSAIAHRRAALDWIRQQDQMSYFWVVLLRLTRVMAYQGNDQVASQYLDLVLKQYRRDAKGGDISAKFCEELPFVLDGQPRSGADVLRKFNQGPLTRTVVEGLECQEQQSNTVG